MKKTLLAIALGLSMMWWYLTPRYEAVASQWSAGVYVLDKYTGEVMLKTFEEE